MNYRFRTPELIPTIATLAVVALTLYLGIWQLQRLAWKNDMIAMIEQAQSEAPRDILSYPPDTLEAAAWHNVIAHGTFLHHKEIHATPRFNNGILGYGILTPLAITTAGTTRYVLVNRGWVPPEHKDAATREEGNTPERVVVEGAIRSAQIEGSGFTQKRFTPDNNPAANLWYWYDMNAIEKQTGLTLLPVIIDATAVHYANGSAIKSGPVPFQIEINIRNDHKGYAITWFLIGLAAIGVYVTYYLEKKPAQ